jgi:ABC-type dipeptide/oligopeptide/nickel transport system permease subunit
LTSASATSDLAAFDRPSRGLAALALRRFVRNPIAVGALVLLIAIFVAGALAHVIAPQGWNGINLSPGVINHAPELSHPLGTDEIGRDVGVRIVYAIRTTEEVALAAALLATLIGVLAGALAGYYGGWLDAIVMRLADLVTAYPAVVLTLAAIVYLSEAYPHNLIFIFAGIMWAVVARVVRAQVATLRTHEFVDAAGALGASDLRIIVRHLLPNLGGTILVAATSLVGQIVLIDATVAFFSYGLPASVSPSLGNLVSDVVKFKFGLPKSATATPGMGWWTWIFPGVVLVLILVSVNLVGDALDAALNPGATRG